MKVSSFSTFVMICMNDCYSDYLKTSIYIMNLFKVDQQNCKQSLDFIDFSCLRQDFH
jgi:hypothetical protein